MTDTSEVISTIYLRCISDVAEKLARDGAAVDAFETRLKALDAVQHTSMAAPLNGSNGNGVEIGTTLGTDAGVSAAAVEKLNGSLGATAIASTTAEADLSRLGASLKRDVTVALNQAAGESLGLRNATNDSSAAVQAAEGRYANYQMAVRAASGDVSKLGAQLRGDLRAALNQAAADQKMYGSVTDATRLQVSNARKELATYEKGIKSAGGTAAAQSANFEKFSHGFTLLTLAGVGVLAASLDASVKLDTVMQTVQGNTGSTAAQMKSLEDQVLSLGAKGPAVLDDIAQGERHISDLGYRGAAGAMVLNEAWKAAIATQGKVADVGNALATVLGNQHASATQAARDIDIIVTAAQQGNLTIPDFANNFAKVGVTTAAMNQPLEQGAALLATISRATGDPALAQTYAFNMEQHVLKPTAAAIKVMDELKTATGIDLEKAFAAAATGQLKFNDLMTLTKKATEGNNAALYTLFGGYRGGTGALIAINSHWEDYNKILGLTETANNHVNTSFQEMQKTAGAELETLKNRVQELGISLGNDLLPGLTGAVNDVDPLVTGLTHLNDVTGGGVSEVIKLGVEWGGAMIVLGKLIPMVVDAKNAMYALAAGETAAETASPVGLIVAGGLAVAAVATTSAAATAKMGDSWNKVKSSYAEGNITLAQAEQRMRDLHLRVEQSTASQLDAARSDDQRTDALKRQSDGLQHLNNFLSERQKLEAQLHPAGISGSDSTKPAVIDLSKQIADAQKHVDDAVNQAATDVENYGHVLTNHQKTLDSWKLKLQSLQDLQSKLTSTTNLSTAALKAADDEVKRLNASSLQLAEEGLAKEKAAFATMADAAIDQAKRMRAGVTAEYDALVLHITKNIPMGVLERPGGVQTTFVGPNQFSTKGPEGSPAASAAALDPQIAGANSQLAATIKTFPSEFQGAFDSELAKYKSQESDLYRTYINSLNRENKADADAINKINSDYQKQLAANWATAQAKDKAEHDRYLQAIQTAEGNYNTKLGNNLQSFNTNFQTSLADFQAKEVAAQTKAETDTTQHEDRLRQLEADNLAKLAAVHGKNAAEQRANIEASYAKSVGAENSRYNGIVSTNETYLKNLGIKFDGHISGLKALFDKQQRDAEKQLTSDEKTAKGKDKTALAGIQSWLDGRDSKAESTREAALAKEAGIYVRVVNGIVEAFDKGGHLIAQHILQDTSAQGQINTLTNKAQDGYDKALAQAELDIIKHGKVTVADADALSKAIDMQDRLTGAQKKALDSIYAGAGPKDFQGTHFSAVGNAAPGTPSIAATVTGGGFAAVTPGIIAGGIKLRDTFEQQVQAGLDQIATSKKTDAVNLEVAKRSGDAAGAYAIINKEFLAGEVPLSTWLTYAKSNAAALAEGTQRTIAGDLAMRDFTGAAGLAKQAMLDGTMSVTDYVPIQKAANAETAHQNYLLLQSDVALGDWTGVLSTAKTAFEDGTITYDQYVGLLKQGNAATAERTRQDTAAAYAAGTLAEKSQMVVQALSGIISRANTIASGQSGVDQANIGVIAAQSAVAVGYLQAQVTATQNLAGIVTAQSGVQTAIFSGQLAAINDSVPILQDMYAISQATSPAALQVAKDQLAIDQLTARADQSKATWDARIAADQAKMAMDKLQVDDRNSAATNLVTSLHLKVSQDALKIALDNQKIALDSLVTLQDIDENLGGDPQAQAILADMKQLQSDQAQSAIDAMAEAIAQANAAQIAGQGNLLLQGDQSQISGDQAGALASSQSFELQLAELKKQLAVDNLSAQQLQQLNQTASALLAATQASQDLLRSIETLNNRGLEGMNRINVAGESTSALLGNMGAQIKANPTAA